MPLPIRQLTADEEDSSNFSRLCAFLLRAMLGYPG
jgi:hypothetical protein